MQGHEVGSLPVALVISNYPIMAVAASAMLGDKYDVLVRTWPAYAARPVSPVVNLAIVDVTTVDTSLALGLLTRDLPEARVAVCSLNCNEVHVYRIGRDGVRVEGALPSLLALAA